MIMKSRGPGTASTLGRITSASRSITPRLPICRQCRAVHGDVKNFFSDAYPLQRLTTLAVFDANHPASQFSERRSGIDFPYTLYPRIPADSSLHPRALVNKYSKYSKDELDRERVKVKVVGKITAIRHLGTNLVFITLTREDISVQIMISAAHLMKSGAASEKEIKVFRSSVRRNDYYAFEGYVCRIGKQDTLSVRCESLPQMLGPSLQDPPTQIENENVLARFPQFNLLNQQIRRDTLRMRHTLEQTMQDSLNGLGFTKVSTPVLAADCGGAVATPFETLRNDGSETKLSLRIAQELALKQLVAADLGPVYEIGPVFRNEGIDATHNPEFTTCEFYLPYTNLQELLHLTESIIRQIAIRIHERFRDSPAINRDITPTTFAHFRRLQFLPALMDQLSTRAPDFRLPQPLDQNAASKLISLFEVLGLELPQERSTAHLLDVLGAEFVESQCKGPTFILNYPAIMSPLAKSFHDPLTGHMVSARAELFINGVEYANMYEEENSPISQAEKFLLQRQNPPSSASHSDLETEVVRQADGRIEQDIKDATPPFLTSPPLMPNMTKIPTARHRHEKTEPPGRSVWGQHQYIVNQLTPGQQYYVKCLEIGMPPTAGWGCGIERLLMFFSASKRISEVMPFGNMRSVIAMGIGGASNDKNRTVKAKHDQDQTRARANVTPQANDGIARPEEHFGANAEKEVESLKAAGS